MEIQVLQGGSPIPEIPGQVYILRIGNVFEAVIHRDGVMCALWDKSEETGWKIIDDPSTCKELLSGVRVREGKSIPKLVTIPLKIERD